MGILGMVGCDELRQQQSMCHGTSHATSHCCAPRCTSRRVLAESNCASRMTVLRSLLHFACVIAIERDARAVFHVHFVQPDAPVAPWGRRFAASSSRMVSLRL